MRYELAIEKLNKIVVFLLVVAVSLMIIIGGMQVFWRYILKSSLYWSEEIMRYLNIWTIFVGISVGIPRNIHVAIDALMRVIRNESAKEWLTKLIYLLSFGFFVLLLVVGTKFMMYNSAQLSPATRLHMSYIYLAIPVGGFLSMLFTVSEFMKHLKRGGVN